MDAVSDPPRIAAFSADRYFVEPGATIEVTWSVENAKEISLTANGEIVDIGGSAAGSRSFVVDEEMVFRLEAGAGSTVSSRELRIGVRIPDSSVLILSFGANPREVDAGEPTKLEWVTRNATKIEVFDAQQNSIPLGGAASDEGSIEVVPDRTTTYRLVVTGEEGTVESTARVQVRGEPRVQASVSGTSIAAGNTVSLNWTVQDALRVIVREVDGDVLLDSDSEFEGSVEVQPARSTAYEVRGVGVWRDSFERVQVHVAPEILSFELVEEGPIGLDKLATLRWSTRGATELVVSNLDGDEETVGGYRVDEGSTRLPMAAGGSFRLKAIGGDGTTVEATVDGEVLGLPSIASFTVDPELQSAQLHPVRATVHWAGIENAERVKLETDTLGRMGIFDPPFEDGSLEFFLKETTTFTFTVSNGAGEVKRTVVATVVPLPEIADFFAFPSHAAVGEPVTVSWGVEGAASLELRFNGQPLPIDPSSGSYTHITAEAGTFQLVAGNSAGGTVERNLPLSVGLPQIVNIAVNRSVLTSSEPLHLSWATRGGIKLTLLENGSPIHETTDPAEIAGATFTVPSGVLATYTYTVRLENGLGDIVDRSLEIIRTDGPVILSVSAPEEACRGEEFAISWTMVPDMHGQDASLSLSLAGEEYELTPQMASQGSFTFPGLPVGSHQGTLTAHTPDTTPHVVEFAVDVDETRFTKLTATPSTVSSGQEVTLEWETVCTDKVIFTDDKVVATEVSTPYTSVQSSGSFHAYTYACGDYEPGDEGCVDIAFPSGFEFPFDGSTHSTLRVFANGLAGFDLDYYGNTYQNYWGYPDPYSPWANFAVFWDDFEDGFMLSGVYTKVEGTAPNRSFVVEWVDRYSLCWWEGYFDFQLVLHEDGTFDYRYPTMNPVWGIPGDCQVIGFQNAAATDYYVVADYMPVPGGLSNKTLHFGPPPHPANGSITFKPASSFTVTMKARGVTEAQADVDIVVQ